jgi:hypothetical protein
VGIFCLDESQKGVDCRLLWELLGAKLRRGFIGIDLYDSSVEDVQSEPHVPASIVLTEVAASGATNGCLSIAELPAGWETDCDYPRTAIDADLEVLGSQAATVFWEPSQLG